MESSNQDQFETISRELSTLIPQDSPLFFANILNEHSFNDTGNLYFESWDEASLQSRNLIYKPELFHEMLSVLRLSIVTGLNLMFQGVKLCSGEPIFF